MNKEEKWWTYPKRTWLIILCKVKGEGAGHVNVVAHSVMPFNKSWRLEDLQEYLDFLSEHIDRDQHPDRYMLKDYLDFTHDEDEPIPTSIRVPETVIEMINAERQRRKLESEERNRRIDEEASRRSKPKH
jgi:hypothetical protein